MTLPPGSELGGFEIVRLLGAGGMGEVYLARDRQLNRNVAVKVLRAELHLEPHRLTRFEQEARAASALSHTNICHIYHLGKTTAGQPYIAMEYVEGETLHDRLVASPLPLREVLEIAIQVAAALTTAHAVGIVHRDIKPENVMIRRDRVVKVLDFGVAKLLSAGNASAPHGPTATAVVTEPGSVVGTIDYMAPEQARGREVDARADIWALGVVTYEMVTGRRPFTGGSRSDVLVRILDREPPPLAREHQELPAELRRIVGKALRKDPEQRYQVVKDLLLDLEALRDAIVWADRGAASDPDGRVQLLAEPRTESSTTRPPSSARSRRLFAGSRLATGLTIGGLGLVLGWLGAMSGLGSPHRESSAPHYDVDLVLDGLDLSEALPTLSPDGRWLVYGATGRLWRRALNGFTPQPLPDSTNATYPFWSPDSRQVGFVRDRKVWRLPIDAANATPIGDAPLGLGGSGAGVWTVAGDLVLAGSDTVGLFSLPVQGGRARDILPLDKTSEIDFHHVAPLPQGRGFLVAIHRVQGPDTIAAFSNGKRHTVLQLPGEAIHSPVYSTAGYLLFERETTIRGIWAVRFDVDRLATAGAPFLVVSGGSGPTVGSDGTLAFVRGWPLRSELVWVDRQGSVGPIGELHGRLGLGSGPAMALSPDGRRLAVSVDGPAGTELWSYDLTRGTTTRLSAGATRVTSPIWTPDGQRVIFGAFGRGRLWNVYSISSSEAREPAPVLKDDAALYRWPCTVSPDGKWLIYGAERADRATDLWLAPVHRPLTGQPLMTTPFREDHARFSPDGRSLVYVSDESGRGEVYVRMFPIGPERLQVSTNGGSMPAWAPDGRAIFYRTPTAVMEVGVTRTASRLTVSTSRELFRIDPELNPFEQFVVASDGRFLSARTRGRAHVGVILNWTRTVPPPEGARR